mgnify:CR=1 FL=1
MMLLQQSFKNTWKYRNCSPLKRWIYVYRLECDFGIFRISIFILYPNPHRIITYKNNHIIDRLKLPYNKADPQGNEITFTISKDYIITVYRNKFTKKGKMIEHKPSAKYKINEDGKFVKIDWWLQVKDDCFIMR